MPSNATERAAQLRAERREQRVSINGRLVATNAPEHGVVWVYLAYGCRCEPCTEANTTYIAESRATKYANREKVDGVWIYPPGPHGSASTYVARGCRCAPCTAAIRESRANARAK